MLDLAATILADLLHCSSTVTRTLDILSEQARTYRMLVQDSPEILFASSAAHEDRGSTLGPVSAGSGTRSGRTTVRLGEGMGWRREEEYEPKNAQERRQMGALPVAYASSKFVQRGAELLSSAVSSVCVARYAPGWLRRSRKFCNATSEDVSDRIVATTGDTQGLRIVILFHGRSV